MPRSYNFCEWISIIQRAAWFCPTKPTAGKLSFELGREYASMKMREAFVWNIVP
jgi:hypothetical protein